MVTQVQKMIWMKKVDAVLHTPGNYRGGILEMCLVLDRRLEQSEVKERVQDIIGACKAHSQVFRNVRLNVVDWTAEKIECQVIPMPVLQMGGYFENWSREIETAQAKTVDALFAYLKKYQARSKLIFVLTKEPVQIHSREQVMESLNPFLKKKLILLQGDEILLRQDA